MAGTVAKKKVFNWIDITIIALVTLTGVAVLGFGLVILWLHATI